MIPLVSIAALHTDRPLIPILGSSVTIRALCSVLTLTLKTRESATSRGWISLQITRFRPNVSVSLPCQEAGTTSLLGRRNLAMDNRSTTSLETIITAHSRWPGAIPWNKAFLRGEWEWRHFDLVATGNYIGDFRDDPNFSANAASVGGPDFRGRVRNVPSYTSLDLQLSYEFVKPPTEPAPYVKESKDSKNAPVTEAATASIWQRMLWNTKLTVGVNDVFDRYPPSVLGAFNDTYDTSLYSIRNRYWYFSLTKEF